MRKLLIVLLDIVLIGSIAVLFGSMSLNQVVTNTITTEAIGNVVSQKMADVVKEYYPDVDETKVAEVQQELESSSTVNDVTDKYLQSVVDAMTTGEDVQLPNMSDDINQIIDENTSTIEDELGVQMTDEQKQQIKNEATQKSNEIQSRLENEANSYIQDDSQPLTKVLKTYQTVQSTSFQVIVGIMIAVACLLIILLSSFSSGLQNIGGSAMISAIGMIFVVPTLFNSVVQHYIGQSMNIDFSQMTHYGYVIAIVGVVCVVIGTVKKKRRA